MVVLDAWAILAVINDEPARRAVATLISERGARMSWINLGEAHYATIRRRGSAVADEAVRLARQTVTVDVPDHELVLSASRLKARGGISYADCFAVATAQRHRLPLVTGDREILALRDEVEVIDPR